MITVVYLLDAKTQIRYPTQWWDNGSGILQQITVDLAEIASGVSPVIGNMLAPGLSNLFSPLPGRGFNVSVWGDYVGVATLNRSFDNSTWFQVDSNFIGGNVSREYQEAESGVLYQLSLSVISSGTFNYRMSQ